MTDLTGNRRKFVASLWPCLMLFELQITKILKSGWCGLEKSQLPLEHNFL